MSDDEMLTAATEAVGTQTVWMSVETTKAVAAAVLAAIRPLHDRALAEARAQALRDAADVAPARHLRVGDWLRARADALDGGTGAPERCPLMSSGGSRCTLNVGHVVHHRWEATDR